MSNLNVQLTGASLQVIDNTASVTRMNTLIAAIVAQATASFYDAYFQVGVGATSLVLPATTIWAVMIRNQSASATVSVTCTPAGGSAWISPLVLPPGGVFLTITPYSSNPGSGGVTAVSILASGAATPAEILLAA